MYELRRCSPHRGRVLTTHRVCTRLQDVLCQIAHGDIYGQVAISNCHGKPRTVWNDIVLSDVQLPNLNHHVDDAQNKPAGESDLLCMYLSLYNLNQLSTM